MNILFYICTELIFLAIFFRESAIVQKVLLDLINFAFFFYFFFL